MDKRGPVELCFLGDAGCTAVAPAAGPRTVVGGSNCPALPCIAPAVVGSYRRLEGKLVQEPLLQKRGGRGKGGEGRVAPQSPAASSHPEAYCGFAVTQLTSLRRSVPR